MQEKMPCFDPPPNKAFDISNLPRNERDAYVIH
jgi:hypothetical protein